MYQPEDRLFCVFAEYKPLEQDPLDGLLVRAWQLISTWRWDRGTLQRGGQWRPELRSAAG